MITLPLKGESKIEETYKIENGVMKKVAEPAAEVKMKSAPMRITFANRAVEDPANLFFKIDPIRREIAVPESEKLLGVQTDEKGERKYFRCPKMIGNNLDLTALAIRILWENANGDKGKYLVKDAVEESGDVVFSWELEGITTAYKGTVRFLVSATRTAEDGTVENQWNTKLASGIVEEGLEIKNPVIPKPDQDVIAQLLQSAEKSKNESAENARLAKAAKEKAEVAETNARTFRDQAQQAATTAGKSAYQIAVQNGFAGTEKQWLDSLKGKTPVKGTDYWTEADKREVVQDVLKALPTWDGGGLY